MSVVDVAGFITMLSSGGQALSFNAVKGREISLDVEGGRGIEGREGGGNSAKLYTATVITT